MALLEFILHIDKYLAGFFQEYGILVYVLVFLIIFAETGLVITPFLPGDSLIFGVGALAASAGLDIWLLFALMGFAAILGDSLNYWIGRKVGPAAIKSGKFTWILKEEYIKKTEDFYKRHGGKTIVLARFVPIVRTFAPFMAGVGAMDYPKFAKYNIAGGILWVGSFLFAGFFFGNLPIVRDNFSLVVGAIIAVSLIPAAWEIVKGAGAKKVFIRKASKKRRKNGKK